MIDFIGYTVGLMVCGERLKKPVLAKVEFNHARTGVHLKLVSGRTLETIKAVRGVVVSDEVFENRPQDSYNDIIEARWAFEVLGVDICGDE